MLMNKFNQRISCDKWTKYILEQRGWEEMGQGEGQNLCLGAQGVEGVGEEERAEDVLGKDHVYQDVTVSALSQS